MKQTFTIIGAALVLCAACQKQEVLQDNPGEGQTINLTLEATRGDDAEATKTAITYNDEYASLESVWTAGDSIFVYSRRSGEKIGVLTQSGDIINQKSSSTSQYPTSYATFKGTVELGSGDELTDDYAFVYQGTNRNLDANEGKLTYEMGTSDDVAGLSAWDLAYATGKIQNTSDLEHASCAVSFTNKMAFGYFTTTGLTSGLKAQYYSGFTFDVKTGTLTGQSGAVTLPDAQAFYMPLVPGTVNMDCDKNWSEQNCKWGYETIKQSKSFTASAGYYYRLGRNATPSFGPVAFEAVGWTLYETLKNSKFSVSASKEVYFTQGNLQYIGSAATPYWRIAPDQYSYLGTANGTPTSTGRGSTIPANTDVDLFGWGEVTPPFKGSTDSKSGTGYDYEHGVTVADKPLPTDWATKFNDKTDSLYAEAGRVYPKTGGNYCCLAKAEWEYLLANQWWGFATVTLTSGSKVKGIVVCPDTTAAGTTAKSLLIGQIQKNSSYKGASNNKARFSDNSINQATIDANGLLFLPAAGLRIGSSVSDAGSLGSYWSTTSYSAPYAYNMLFNASSIVTASHSYSRCHGFSVRLACLVPTE